MIELENKKYTPQEKYDKKNAVHVTLKFNKKTDSDIIQAIEGKSKQTEIKRLIRIALERD